MSNLFQSAQLPLMIGCFLIGALLTLILFRMPPSDKPWRIADLVWVVLGGIGALTALIAGIYAEDSTRLERQVAIAHEASIRFDHDAARFRLTYCEATQSDTAIPLCEKVEFLSASTAKNAALPLFISATQRAAPLRNLPIFGRMKTGMPEMIETADAFDPDTFLAFETRDPTTNAALIKARKTDPAMAADYQVLALAYDHLIAQVSRLKIEWDVLRANAHILLLQMIALCLVAFAAPFRLGKSLKDLI
ncbi:hypothetical protein [Shimia sediminis]|uniref:hypothetical protein n=1 Tax=Shimia sediminis TaxID=2497945 RepID=UPI000F8EB45A|nr:hypothetical protein [Shimia sediminis]